MSSRLRKLNRIRYPVLFLLRQDSILQIITSTDNKKKGFKILKNKIKKKNHKTFLRCRYFTRKLFRNIKKTHAHIRQGEVPFQ